MGLHPQYLSSFWKTQRLLLCMDGPLPYHKRHYIAIMALLKTGENSWSLAELVQALVLLAHYHALASFVFGCGINPEAEQDEGPHGDRSPARDEGTGVGELSGKDAAREVEALMERMKLLRESPLEEEGVTQEEMATRFEMEKTESLLVAPSGAGTREAPREGTQGCGRPRSRRCRTDVADQALQPGVLCFVEDPAFGYKDFTRRGEQAPPTFRAQDYTWEDHGYSLINRLYPDVGQLLDEKFQVVYNLTYNTIAMHCGVDTSVLRRAIWNYVHCIFGIRYDDYDYGEVNQLLERSLKIYIKTVACYPEKTTKRMYAQFWRHFKHSEKVHVNLLLLEARLQAALLYALRAVTRYMT
ncbi:sestrin-2-like [Nothoprocta perdicaria]|nr:sestrin-2-like [Nothoprocta perdicaria]